MKCINIVIIRPVEEEARLRTWHTPHQSPLDFRGRSPQALGIASLEALNGTKHLFLLPNCTVVILDLCPFGGGKLAWEVSGNGINGERALEDRRVKEK